MRRDWPGIEYAPGKIIVGQSPAMERVFFLLNQYAPSSAPVLVTGDTGTGKELVARAIHYHSGRTGRFVAVNCASVSDSLFESEFFGHRRGAFTGALADRAGWFEQAENGTLFLDELGEMPLLQQAKLLRVIEDSAVVPVGATAPVHVGVRVVAATNADLEAAVEGGCFRRDLLDRLNVLPLHLPPLRERAEDLPLLVEHFFEWANAEEGTQVLPPADGHLQALVAGGADLSIRVLRNAIRRLVVVKRRGRVETSDLVEAGLLPADAAPHCDVQVEPGKRGTLRMAVEVDRGTPLRDIVTEVEVAAVEAALQESERDVAEAIHKLGISKSVWYRIQNSRQERNKPPPRRKKG
jgi:two-component system response regulator PilR (NtrC family)